jgi:hypothetical protein
MAAERTNFNPQVPLHGYLTDGSPIRWADTKRFKCYEFLFESEDVPVGERILKQIEYPTLEAEWIIYFPEGMPPEDQIDSSTRVCLTGMAEAKRMTGISLTEAYNKGEMSWSKMSLRNDVIAKGDCILTTIGEIAGGGIQAEVVIKEVTESGKQLVWENHARSLENKDLVDYLKHLSRDARSQDHPVAFVNLGATDKNSALVNDTFRRVKSFLKGLPTSLFSKERVLQIMFCDAIRNRHYTRWGELKVMMNGQKIASATVTTQSAPKTSDLC